MAITTEKTIKVKLDQELDPTYSLSLATWRANATTFDVGVFSGLVVESVANVESINCKVMASKLSATILADKTMTAFDDTLDAATWTDESKKHCAFEFSNAEMNLDLLNLQVRVMWIVFTAILDDGSEVTLGAGDLSIYEDNNAAGDPPPENVGTAVTLEQADARYEPTKGADDNYITDAEKVVIGNTSNTNTGDNSANSTYSNVDNTSDANKPVSTATQTALDAEENARIAADKITVSTKTTDFTIADADNNSVQEVTTSATVTVSLNNSITVGTSLVVKVIGSGVITFATTGTATANGALKLLGTGNFVNLYKSSATAWEIISPFNAFLADIVNYAANTGISDLFRLGKLDNVLRWANQESDRSAHNGAEWTTLSSDPLLVSAHFLPAGLNAGSGTTAYDLNGDHDATLGGAVAWAGKSMTFPDTGAGDSLIVSDAASLDVTSLTMCAWAKLRNGASGDSYIFGKDDLSTSRSFWMRWVGGSKLMAFVSSDGSGATKKLYVDSGASFLVDTWSFVAATFTEHATNGTFKLFHNSTELTTTKTTDNSVPAIYQGSADLCIGGLNATNADNWDGNLSFTGIFGRALTADEQSDLQRITQPTQ